MTDRYALVGCGKAKREGTHPARELYTSDYFRQKAKWAEENCEIWWVLSAKHGAIHPDKEIESYDRRIQEADTDLWARDVSLVLHGNDLRWLGDSELHVLAGQAYIKPIRDVLDGLPCAVVYPFEDTEGIGEQRAWLADELDGEDDTTQEGLDAWA